MSNSKISRAHPRPEVRAIMALSSAIAPGKKAEGHMPSCSVVICTRDRPAELDRCLEAVSQLGFPRADVLVVDNAPCQAPARDVASRWGVRYLLEPVVGLSCGRNCGARACQTEVVAFLDDDALPEPGWLRALAMEFADPLVMAVAGRIRPLSGETEVERLGARITGFGAQGEERRIVDRSTPSWFEIANFGGLGAGGNLAFRRRAFEFWSGFDERLGRGTALEGSEEHLAFFKLIDHGYRVVYTPHAIVWHPIPKTLQQLRDRYMRLLASATGYFTLLLIEETRYRRTTLRYIFQALRSAPRPWRGEAPDPLPRIVPRWRAFLACLSGPLLYLRARLDRRSVAG